MAVKILKFGATWCNACTQADRYLARTTHDVDIELIDVDQDEELAIKYQIRNIPTFLAVKPNGDIVSKMVGFDVAKFKKFIEDVKNK